MSEPPMYFQEPAQLLNIFTALEEQNLFLIQNSQETEQALEELKQTFRSTKAEMDKKTIALKSNIKELDGQIAAEEEKADALRRRAKSSVGEDEQKKMLEGLKTKVQKTYETCGFDAESNPSTLTMLTDLEAKLEELLTTIEQMPEEYVERAEKAKERERRDRVRGERLEAQQEAQAEKMRISMRRSRQPPKRKTGKPVMMRSKPLFRRKKVEKVAETDEHAADAQYFA
jgi:septal ring factor EnvC (AmiA/AmiB activator)